MARSRASVASQPTWQLYLVYALFGIGYTCISVLPATTLITRWFDARQRPLALSFSSTGLSLGGVILTPLSAALLARWPIEHATPLLGGVFALVIVPIVWFGVRSFPAHPAPAPLRRCVREPRSRSRCGRGSSSLLTRGYLLAMGAQVGDHRAHVQTRRRGCDAAAGVVRRVGARDAVGASGGSSAASSSAACPIKAFALVNGGGPTAGISW